MTEPTELLPCPFCGAAAHFEMDEGRWEWVECESCGMQGNRSASLMEDCKPKLAEEWNQRTPPAVAGEPVFAFRRKGLDDFCTCTEERYAELSAKPNLFETRIFYTTPQPTHVQAVAMPLTDREIELIDGMIQVQLDHASRCDAIANRSMADKQKGWDMERVALLQKFKAHGIKGGQHVS